MKSNIFLSVITLTKCNGGRITRRIKQRGRRQNYDKFPYYMYLYL